MVDKERIKKLINEIIDSMSFILRTCSKQFEELSEAERYAIRYNVIVIAEALTSIAMHIAREILGIEPETPTHAIRVLAERNIMSTDVANDLIRIIRLRHILVHRYWTVDDRFIYNSVKKDFSSVKQFIDAVLKLVQQL